MTVQFIGQRPRDSGVQDFARGIGQFGQALQRMGDTKARRQREQWNRQMHALSILAALPAGPVQETVFRMAQQQSQGRLRIIYEQFREQVEQGKVAAWQRENKEFMERADYQAKKQIEVGQAAEAGRRKTARGTAHVRGMYGVGEKIVDKGAALLGSIIDPSKRVSRGYTRALTAESQARTKGMLAPPTAKAETPQGRAAEKLAVLRDLQAQDLRFKMITRTTQLKAKQADKLYAQAAKATRQPAAAQLIEKADKLMQEVLAEMRAAQPGTTRKSQAGVEVGEDIINDLLRTGQ